MAAPPSVRLCRVPSFDHTRKYVTRTTDAPSLSTDSRRRLNSLGDWLFPSILIEICLTNTSPARPLALSLHQRLGVCENCEREGGRVVGGARTRFGRSARSGDGRGRGRRSVGGEAGRAKVRRRPASFRLIRHSSDPRLRGRRWGTLTNIIRSLIPSSFLLHLQMSQMKYLIFSKIYEIPIRCEAVNDNR